MQGGELFNGRRSWPWNPQPRQNTGAPPYNDPDSSRPSRGPCQCLIRRVVFKITASLGRPRLNKTPKFRQQGFLFSFGVCVDLLVTQLPLSLERNASCWMWGAKIKLKFWGALNHLWYQGDEDPSVGFVQPCQAEVIWGLWRSQELFVRLDLSVDAAVGLFDSPLSLLFFFTSTEELLANCHLLIKCSSLVSENHHSGSPPLHGLHWSGPPKQINAYPRRW